MSAMSSRSQEAEILRQAEAKGVSTNYFFKTTFERYKYQLKILRQLKKKINELGPVVSKEYVKGRENVVANPAIAEYNKTSTAANGTVATLINIIKNFADDEKSESRLQALIDSLNDD